MAKGRRRPSKPDATGRNVTSRFARLDHRLLASNAYRALNPNARSLLTELVMLYNGENNGSLYLGVRDAAHRMGIADTTGASRAFDELQELGFIEMTQDAHFKVKASEVSRARCWRLTWEAGPGRKAPSSEFLTREPEPQTLARRRMERGLRALKVHRRAHDQNKLPVLDSHTLSALRPDPQPLAVLESNTLNDRDGSFQPNHHVRDSATHIAIPWGSAPQCNLIGWWQPDWPPSMAALILAASLTSAQSATGNIRKAAA